jgi:hypothetical protein
VRNEEVLLRVNEQRNILHEIRKRKANWIGHILHRNCLLQQVIEGKIKGQIEVTKMDITLQNNLALSNVVVKSREIFKCSNCK